MKPYPGQDWTKHGRTVHRQTWFSFPKRLAQVSAVDDEYAYMYWPDKDTETRVRLKRFNRTTEWVPR